MIDYPLYINSIAYSQPTDLRLEDVVFEEFEQQAPTSRIMSFSQPTTHIQDDYESPIEGRPNQVSVSF